MSKHPLQTSAARSVPAILPKEDHLARKELQGFDLLGALEDYKTRVVQDHKMRLKNPMPILVERTCPMNCSRPEVYLDFRKKYGKGPKSAAAQAALAQRLAPQRPPDLLLSTAATRSSSLPSESKRDFVQLVLERNGKIKGPIPPNEISMPLPLRSTYEWPTK
mmetsp:Transcript_97752/g.203961  ORF Transcript_97752/g.203961 Transcript_97752/m.203961 type:complete len:163 (-) Transcript_97752:23-511(-)